jgi:hypothetical protein
MPTLTYFVHNLVVAINYSVMLFSLVTVSFYSSLFLFFHVSFPQTFHFILVVCHRWQFLQLGSASPANVPLVPPCIDLLLIVAGEVEIPELLM